MDGCLFGGGDQDRLCDIGVIPATSPCAINYLLLCKCWRTLHKVVAKSVKLLKAKEFVKTSG